MTLLPPQWRPSTSGPSPWGGRRSLAKVSLRQVVWPLVVSDVDEVEVVDLCFGLAGRV